MPTELVTSFSAAGAELYGRRCVESIVTHWPYPLMVYTDTPMDVTTRLTSDIPGWRETKAILPSTRPDAPRTGYDEWTRKPTNYIWNAQRFAVKPFVWLDAAQRLDRGILVWLDGDTVTTKPIPATLPLDVLGDADVAYLGRGAMHPENGFVAFRVPEALPLLRACCATYRTGFFESFADGWTDCHVLRAEIAALPVKARDLTSHLWDGEWRSTVDAMALSPLGPYVTHFKGSRQKREASCVA
jgi:hypothetical protein